MWDMKLLGRVESLRLRQIVDYAVVHTTPAGVIEGALASRFMRESLESLAVRVNPDDVKVAVSDKPLHRELTARWGPSEVHATVVGGGPMDGFTCILESLMPALRLAAPPDESRFSDVDYSPTAVLASRIVAAPLVGWSEDAHSYLYRWPTA